MGRGKQPYVSVCLCVCLCNEIKKKRRMRTELNQGGTESLDGRGKRLTEGSKQVSVTDAINAQGRLQGIRKPTTVCVCVLR